MLHPSTSTLVDINQNNIFAFWESPNPIPAYLDLCRDTWIKNIPNCKIHILNHSNLHEYIGNTYDLEKLKTISFAMQSDIISAAVLEKFGGLFLDLDCIVTDDIFDIFNNISDTKLISFGRPDSKAIHLAVLFCRAPNNPILREWRKAAQERLQNKPEKYPWHYFGNGIINPLLNKSEYKNDFYIIDRTQSGNILESAVFGDNPNKAIEDYKNLYFNDFFSFSPTLLEKVNCGVISLHNSWSPPEYKNMSNKVDFLNSHVPISGLLDYILNNNTKKPNRNIFPIIESFISRELSNRKIKFSSKYFRNMLVLDFLFNGISFAFDVSLKNNLIHLDFIIRNIPSDKIKNLSCFLDKNFNANKAHIISDIRQDKILTEVLTICSFVEKLDIENLGITSNVYRNNLEETIIDLQKFKLVENILYLEGIGIIVGQSAKEYGNIDYQLIIKGVSSEYVKNMGKAHRPELTKTYAADTNFSYDKCWFATQGYKGVDISDIPLGQYELLLKITVNGFEKTQSLRSQKAVHIKNALFSFESSDKGNKLIIKQNLKDSIQKIRNAFQSKLGKMSQNESKLEFHYPNPHHPILIQHDLMENHISFACGDEQTLNTLYQLVQAQDGRISIDEHQQLLDVLLPVLAKTEQFIIANTKFTNSKIKVNGYYQDEYNNIIEAPFDLHNVHVQFFGKNNRVVLHENANLKNTFIEFKGDNATFSIGDRAGIFGTFRLGYNCHIAIGDSVTSTNAVYVTCAEKTRITIGNDCMFATNNQIRTDDSHAIYDVNTGKRVNPSKNIVIGNHVWIAYGATILGGSEIGGGSVIGAYSLVKKPIPNNCVAAGVPAKVIKTDIFWERPLLLNKADEKIFPSEYLQTQEYIAKTEV